MFQLCQQELNMLSMTVSLYFQEKVLYSVHGGQETPLIFRESKSARVFKFNSCILIVIMLFT